MSQEQILDMLESGKITADEAARLLDALAAGKETPAESTSPEPTSVEPVS